MNDLIYLDYNATTPVDPRVLDAMLPYFRERFGNAASRHHRLGCQAAEAVERARGQVAAVLGADPREILFTSGATESNNLALKGVLQSPYYAKRGDHLVTVTTEHKAVLDPCESLSASGVSVSVLPVEPGGEIDLDRLSSALTERTILVSVMHGNNEIGVLQPIAKIGALCRERGILLHSDATQSFGKEALDVERLGLSLLSLSGHKLYGPKGVGALYVRRRDPRVRCEALMEGGGHERGLRSGTLNVPGIVGLGMAAQLANQGLDEERDRIRGLRDRFEEQVAERLGGVRINGGGNPRLSGTSNLSFAGVDGEELMKEMPEVAVSSASACTSASLQPSYVLGALGLDEEAIHGSVRFSLGRFTTVEEVERAIDIVCGAVEALRRKTGVSGSSSASSCDPG